MGFRDWTALTSVGTSATKLYSLPKMAGKDSYRPVKVRKLLAYNTSASDVTVWLCASDGTHLSPGLKIIAGQTVLLNERELPAVRYGYGYDGIYAVADATGVELQLEVEVLEAAEAFKPIAEKFLQPNYLFALEFREGFVFGRTVRRRVCHYKPLPLVDGEGNPVSILSNSYGGAEYQLLDPRNPGRDILYLDASTNSGWAWILHGSVGVYPEWMYVYPRLPSGQDYLGRFPNLDTSRPYAGDETGYIGCAESPYESPTDFAEFVIPPKIHAGFEFFNKDPVSN